MHVLLANQNWGNILNEIYNNNLKYLEEQRCHRSESTNLGLCPRIVVSFLLVLPFTLVYLTGANMISMRQMYMK